MSNTVITFGTFDLFHIGHLMILERAASLGSNLVVGVSSDKLNFEKKQRYPTYSEDDRMGIVSALKVVDSVFLEESLELKAEYVEKHNADVLVMGDDWSGKFDWVSEKANCSVMYLPRTEIISTSYFKQKIKAEK